MLDPSTYELLTEDQANHDIAELWKDIHAWTVRHHSLLPDDTVNFIREHMNKATADPLGYFYLLIKLHKLPIPDTLSARTVGAYHTQLDAMWMENYSQS